MHDSVVATISRRTKNATRLSRRARIGVGLAPLLFAGVVTGSPTASAQSSYCQTVSRLIDTGDLAVRIESTDSATLAVEKVIRLRNGFAAVQRVAPIEIRTPYGRIVTGLTALRSDFQSLVRSTPARARVIRFRITDRMNAVQSFVGVVRDHVIETCDLSGIGAAGPNASVVPSDTSGATPTAAGGSTGGTTRTIPGTGVYEIGKDIAPGFYTTRGGTNCRAGQTDDPTGKDPTAGFIASVGVGVTTQNVETTYRYFVTDRCADWVPGTLA